MKLQQPKKLAKELVASKGALSKYSVIKVLVMIEELEKGEKINEAKLMEIDGIGKNKAKTILKTLKNSNYFPNSKITE